MVWKMVSKERRDALASLCGRMAIPTTHRLVAPPDVHCPISGVHCVCAYRHCPLCALRFGRRVCGVNAAHRACLVVVSRNASVRCGLRRAVNPATSGTGESQTRAVSRTTQGRGQAGRRAPCGRKCTGERSRSCSSAGSEGRLCSKLRAGASIAMPQPRHSSDPLEESATARQFSASACATHSPPRCYHRLGRRCAPCCLAGVCRPVLAAFSGCFDLGRPHEDWQRGQAT